MLKLFIGDELKPLATDRLLIMSSSLRCAGYSVPILSPLRSRLSLR